MEASQFRTAAAQMIEFITDYQENIRSRAVSPNVSPGYLRELVPDHAPEKAETWDQVRQPVLAGVRFGCYFIRVEVFPKFGSSVQICHVNINIQI